MTWGFAEVAFCRVPGGSERLPETVNLEQRAVEIDKIPPKPKIWNKVAGASSVAFGLLGLPIPSFGLGSKHFECSPGLIGLFAMQSERLRGFAGGFPQCEAKGCGASAAEHCVKPQ